VVFGASIASAISAISWSLVNAMVVYLPYQIQLDCKVQRKSEPGARRPPGLAFRSCQSPL
jgi:hypothetical protein